MTWVTLSNGACPPFFPLEAGIFDLAGPLNSRGKRGVAPKKKCRGVHAPIGMLFRGKSVTHVMRSCRQRVCLGSLPRTGNHWTRTAKQSFLKESSRLKKNSAAKFAIARTRSLPQARDEPPAHGRASCALPRACNAALVFFKTGTIGNA